MMGEAFRDFLKELILAELAQQGFPKDVCRSMVAMMDADRSGKLGYEEFKELWVDIRNWKVRNSLCSQTKGFTVISLTLLLHFRTTLTVGFIYLV